MRPTVLHRLLPRLALAGAVEAVLASKGRVIVCGMGKSGLIGNLQQTLDHLVFAVQILAPQGVVDPGPPKDPPATGLGAEG